MVEYNGMYREGKNGIPMGFPAGLQPEPAMRPSTILYQKLSGFMSKSLFRLDLNGLEGIQRGGCVG